jgi:hypothetical protein
MKSKAFLPRVQQKTKDEAPNSSLAFGPVNLSSYTRSRRYFVLVSYLPVSRELMFLLHNPKPCMLIVIKIFLIFVTKCFSQILSLTQHFIIFLTE